MTQTHLQSTSLKNVRLVPVEPNVKSSKTREMSLRGVRAISKTAKVADPLCYASPVSRKIDPAVDAAGLFENMEMKMTTFKKGEAVWLYYTSEPGGYPGLYHRPGIITKRIHPTSYMVAFVANDYERPVKQWTLDRRSHDHHPSEMLPFSRAMPFEDNHCNAKERLHELRDQWKAEAPPEKQAAWWASEEKRERTNRELNRKLGPILARMMT